MSLVVLLSLPAGGCYKHVIRAEGPGADRYEIHEPNLPEKPSIVDELLWGDQVSEPAPK